MPLKKPVTKRTAAKEEEHSMISKLILVQVVFGERNLKRFSRETTSSGPFQSQLRPQLGIRHR